MPDIHKLRLRIEYDVLYAADLRKIVGTFEGAYNVLQKAALQRAVEPGRRMRRADRLIVQSVRTDNPLTLMALGGMGLAALGSMFGTRELFWRSEKTKWEAKTARLDYEEKVRQVEASRKLEQVEAALDGENAPEAKAAKLLGKLNKFIEKSKDITSIYVEIDGQDTDPQNPGALIISKGRKFR